MYTADTKFNRKEIEIASYRRLCDGRVKKADGIFVFENASMIHELMLLETEKHGDEVHIEEDKWKLARCLRTCLLQSVLKSGNAAFLTKIPFFGVQTHGIHAN